MTDCPLCGSNTCFDYGRDRYRGYFRCKTCDFVFVQAFDHLTSDEELLRYSTHENTLDNPNYIEYLSSIINTVLSYTNANPAILDFGCGQNAVMTSLLLSRGIQCTPYDPLYGIHVDANCSFDCVVACEVVEHFRNPLQDLQRIAAFVKDGGVVYIRTRLVDDEVDFTKWYYAKDLTHIGFYSLKTMEYVKGILQKDILFTNNKDVVVFGKR